MMVRIYCHWTVTINDSRFYKYQPRPLFFFLFFSFCSVLRHTISFFPESSSSLQDLSLPQEIALCLLPFNCLNLVRFNNMPFAYLLKTRENVESFKVRYNIPRDIKISYCHEGDIEEQRLPHIVFFPLMSILKGGIRFLVDHLLLRTLSFYGLSLDQCLPNFYRVVNCVGRLNRLYGLSLTHQDINFMYSI